MTWIWPEQPAPAPMPIVGIAQPLGDRRGQLARDELEHDRERAGLLDRERVGEQLSSLLAGLALDPDLPIALIACGVSPMWPITGIPALTIASMMRALRTPPSTLTACVPPSRRKRPALWTASSGV